MKFSIGQEVWVPCVVAAGPFGELLITVESAGGPLSGFVRKHEVKGAGTDQLVRGTVLAVTDELVMVRLRGSFFTTALGQTSIKSERLQAIA